MIRSGTIFALALFACSITTAADAQRRTARANLNQAPIVCNERGCSDYGKVRSRTRASKQAHVVDANGNAVIVGGRPAGCPHRFCGCAASLYLFGKIRPELNLASNWIRKFARTAPAPGMAAARPGHVMVLVNHVSNKDWLVYDGNSGGGLIRRHVRSIAGYVIVDPHATRTAEAAPRPRPRPRPGSYSLANASAETSSLPTLSAY